jgi:F420-non-reducing hydrogenase large subunit
MGMVDKNNRVNFYDGDVRVVTPEGKEFAKFRPKEYLDHIAEHVEPWSYVKYPYLKKIGWKGFVDGGGSGVYRVAPLARLNVADGMATPLAQTEYERMYKTLGGKPVHNTLAFHWARLVEALYAAERMLELALDKEITDPHVRNIPIAEPKEGIGIVEAPRGTLIHHYKTDRKGIITEANLVVATVNNAAAICMSIEKAAKGLIKNGHVSDGLLNMVEMAFRAYDPCFACATHALPGKMPLWITLRDRNGDIVQTIKR